MKNLNFKLIQRDLENWIKEKVGDRGVVIGLSGGIDSSVTCILAKNALGANKVKGIIFAINRQEMFTDDNGNVSYYGYKITFNSEGQLNFTKDKLQLIDSKKVLKAKFKSEQAEIKKALINKYFFIDSHL